MTKMKVADLISEPLLQRLEETAADIERRMACEDLHIELREAAAAIRELVGLLSECESAVSTNHQTGNDTFRCPLCSGGGIHGLPARHDQDCRLAAALAKYGG